MDPLDKVFHEFLPEFPLKRDLIWPELRTDKSVKVDYVLFAKDQISPQFRGD